MWKIFKKNKPMAPNHNTGTSTKKILKKTAFMLDMKRRNKFITFFALFFIAVYLCMPSMETIIKKVVHKYGSEITGTNVNLQKVNIKLSAGEAGVKGVTIGNPKGYKSKNLFALNEVSVKLNVGSVTQDTIIIENVLIDNPVITYEMLSLTQNNVSDILANIKANTASTSKNETPKEVKSSSSDKNEKKVIIKKLTVQNGQIEVMAGFGEYKNTMTLPLPTIVLKDIGQEKKGTSVAETISTVLQKILQTATQAVASSGFDSLNAQIKQSADIVKNAAEKTQESLKKLFN